MENSSLALTFPIIPHESAGGGIDCCGCIVPEEQYAPGHDVTLLRCNECGAPVGTVSTGILRDLVSLTSTLDNFVPDSEHINALPGPLRKYVHDLETRVDPAGEVRENAMLRDTVRALQARISELGG